MLADKKAVARPTDPDLDLDIDGIVIRSFVRTGDDFIVSLAGGSGRWADKDGEMADVAVVTEMEMTFGYEMTAGYEHILEALVAQLDRWSKNATPLRLLGAPGRYTVLIEPGVVALPIPRRAEAEPD